MGGQIDTTTCARHSRREAVTDCVSCGAPVCTDCASRTPVGVKCPDCWGVATSSPSSGRPWARIGLIAGALVVVVVVALIVVPNDSTPLTAGDLGLPEPIRFTAADGTELTGVIDLPPGEGPHPAALVVTGFGNTDAIGIGAVNGEADPLYRELGAHVSTQGVAVLRYDKRWIGDGSDDDPLTWEDRVADAAAALEYLRSRADIDPNRVSLIGHGEGSLVATQLAQGAAITSLVLISPWGRPLVDVLATEFTRNLPPGENYDTHAELAETLRARVAALVSTGQVPDRDDLPEIIRQVFPTELDVYSRELFEIDPARVAAGISAPVLLIHGGLDPCVQLDLDVQRLREVMSTTATVEIVTRPESGHTLLLDRPVGATHGDVMPGMQGTDVAQRDQEALAEISTWLHAQSA